MFLFFCFAVDSVPFYRDKRDSKQVSRTLHLLYQNVLHFKARLYVLASVCRVLLMVVSISRSVRATVSFASLVCMVLN